MVLIVTAPHGDPKSFVADELASYAGGIVLLGDSPKASCNHVDCWNSCFREQIHDAVLQYGAANVDLVDIHSFQESPLTSERFAVIFDYYDQIQELPDCEFLLGSPSKSIVREFYPLLRSHKRKCLLVEAREGLTTAQRKPFLKALANSL